MSCSIKRLSAEIVFLVTVLTLQQRRGVECFTPAPPPSAPDALENLSQQHYQIGPTFHQKSARPLDPKLREAVLKNEHPIECQEELGRGKYIISDWRHAWYTYESPDDDPGLIHDETGYACYEISDIDGKVPDDIVGDLYRNGPGKLGVNGERVQHVLDGDGLIIKMTFPPPNDGDAKRKIEFKSRFVETTAFQDERQANDYVYRGTFGTAPRGLKNIFGEPPRRGVNADPSTATLLSRMAGNAFRTIIKNTANTHVVSYAGKVLALYEAGLPYSIDPDTLETLGEDEMGGALLKEKMAVKLRDDLQAPQDFVPSFLGGAAHTAHPKLCPRTKHLVGWHWSSIVPDESLEVTLTEWSDDDFEVVARNTHTIPGCSLAPHDMALTEECVVLLVNALEMNRLPFLLGVKGPAESLSMDGRAPVKAVVLPRPTAANQFEPYTVDVPPCFSIHFSHGYQDERTGHLVTFFSGWPASDSKDFLGAWGGFCPDFAVVPPTFLWRLEIDPSTQSCVDLSVAPGASNVCLEHCVVHPNFATRQAQNVYTVASNLVGDSSAPNGYVRVRVEDGSTRELRPGEVNEDVDAYWFGTRYFAEEPMIVPKHGGDPKDEDDAYLLAMVFDATKKKSALAIFDLKEQLREGPVCMLWLKSHVPHGLHGCFAPNGGGSTSTFC
jgi:all-trans-8'-apo-beta-carotenal 15,15'-oxygenase